MIKNIIEKELLELREYSEKNEEKQKKFWSDKKLLNKRTGEIEDVTFDLKKEYELRYNDLIFKSIYFQKEMQEAKADWQMIFYSGAVHSFSHKNAGNDNSKGAAYNELADKRSFTHFLTFLKEIL